MTKVYGYPPLIRYTNSWEVRRVLQEIWANQISDHADTSKCKGNLSLNAFIIGDHMEEALILVRKTSNVHLTMKISPQRNHKPWGNPQSISLNPI